MPPLGLWQRSARPADQCPVEPYELVRRVEDPDAQGGAGQAEEPGSALLHVSQTSTVSASFGNVAHHLLFRQSSVELRWAAATRPSPARIRSNRRCGRGVHRSAGYFGGCPRTDGAGRRSHLRAAARLPRRRPRWSRAARSWASTPSSSTMGRTSSSSRAASWPVAVTGVVARPSTAATKRRVVTADCSDPTIHPARVRAMYTSPAFARRGVGRLILSLCEAAAAAEALPGWS